MGEFFVTKILPLTIPFRVPQKDAGIWLKSMLSEINAGNETPGLERTLRLYDRFNKTSEVSYRHTCIDDYTHTDWPRMNFFHSDNPVELETPWYVPSLQKRMQYYSDYSDKIVNEALVSVRGPPDLMTLVTCTGYESPNVLQRNVNARDWNADTRILNIGHMGCYAAIPALDTVGQWLCGMSDPRKSGNGLIVLIELTTLHLHPESTEIEQQVINSLFADGAALIEVSDSSKGAELVVLATTEEIIPGTENYMTWTPADGGFCMTLDVNVSKKVAEVLPEFTEKFLKERMLRPEDIDFFAVHPGGPKILDAVAGVLNLSAEQIGHSRKVLRDRGNMSSATLPHIWQAMIADPVVRPGARILSLGFGPGLTVAANLLRRC